MTTNCTKTLDGVCIKVRTRTCLSHEVTCSGSNAETLPCDCPTGEIDHEKLSPHLFVTVQLVISETCTTILEMMALLNV